MECQLENITVHYEVFGERRSTIVLHGWSLDHRHEVSALEPIFQHREGWKEYRPENGGQSGR